MNHVDILIKVLDDLAQDKKKEAACYLENNYKHTFINYETRTMSHYEKLKIFIKDGFIDRYTGKRLFFPNVLRIISMELGNSFPYHSNWKMSHCHIAYWEMFPTYDHIIPIARGGKDEPNNIVTTSQMINSSKSGFLVEEIGLTILSPGKISDWDGMIHWYLDYVNNHTISLNDSSFKAWHQALQKCLKEKIII